ncbi:MAG: YheC/YheD family protein [bacterium]|nr:YheC/YheD family protein [bacterium]
MIFEFEPAPGASEICLPSTVGVSPGKTLILRLGTARVTARTTAGPATGAAMGTGAARRLGLSLPARLRARWHPDRRTLRIGPVVGILVRKARSQYGPFGPQAGFIRELMDAAGQLGVFLYAFGPGDVSWGRRRVRGYRYRGQGVWTRGLYPYPDVLWDRGFFRGAAQRRYWGTRMGLARAHRRMRFINAIYGNKWRVHRVLLRSPEVRPHLPETRRASSGRVVAAMARRHGTVYLKPAGGLKGRGIMRLERVGQGRFRLRAGTRSRGGSLSRLAAIARRRGYLVQQGIDLARPFGPIGDLRLVVQKDGAGNWSVTGGAMRVAATGHITSNIHRGGHAEPLDAAVRAVVGEGGYAATADLISRVATGVARAVERASGPSGEMGVDLALDREGRVWFLETNSKLARSIFLQLGETETRRRSIERPLLWAARRSGFAVPEDEREASFRWPG